jgi:hypothetical protein
MIRLWRWVGWSRFRLSSAEVCGVRGWPVPLVI